MDIPKQPKSIFDKNELVEPSILKDHLKHISRQSNYQTVALINSMKPRKGNISFSTTTRQLSF